MKKGNDIKVSIITVSLNSEKTIEQTIKSVLHQTYTNVEYIIIDGGSTDGTIDIIHKYADRIAYFVSEPDNGLYDAMNKGIRVAKGELIGIINSDDWYELDAVEIVVSLLVRNIKADVIHGGIRIYDNERFSSVYCPKTSELKLCMIPHPACFVTKKAYQKFGTYNLNYKIAADYELLARIYTSNGQFIFYKKPLANLRLGGASDLHRKTGHYESEELKKRYNLKYTASYLSMIKEYKTKTIKYLNKKVDKLYCSIARLRLKNRKFTIISNDCWGGGVYEDLNLPYSTPTVGLFFYSPCYIEFLEDFDFYIKQTLTFKKMSKYDIANKYREKENHYYPIGCIDSIEIHFLHYDSEREAEEKWERRKKRIVKDNIFIKFSDRDLCTIELMNRFDKLPFRNKVLFSSKSIEGIKSNVLLNQYRNEPFIGDIYSNRWAYRNEFDVVKWLNNGLK